jgi:hypothetical protein
LGGRRDSSEREKIIEVLTNDTTWRQSYGDDHTTTLIRGGWWCFDGEMVPGTRRRDWNWGWVWWIMR